METHDFQNLMEMKPDLESLNTICRCCLAKEKRMKNISNFTALFRELAGINVSESDGLPQWVCHECSALLQKSVRFKQKLLRAHNMLYDYLIRCTPFPIDGQDPELAKYASPTLSCTLTLAFDYSGKGRLGFHRNILQHIKQFQKSKLDTMELPFIAPPIPDAPTQLAPPTDAYDVKPELDFDDYEDNITLDEYRSNIKLTEEEVSKITEDDLAELLQESELKERCMEPEKKRRKTDKGRKRKNTSPSAPSKPSARKAAEPDPAKIRVVTLNPAEQIKQREEESKASMRFPYQCSLCFKGFNFESKLQNHMGKHSPSRGPFECRLCSTYLPSAYSLQVHARVHTRRYECRACLTRMIDLPSILNHYKSQHEGIETVYTCHICGKISNNNKTHRGHMRNHHGGARPECHQCGKTFVNKDSLVEHLQIHAGVKNYECDVCSARFRTRAQIKQHQLSHSADRLHYCVECDIRFKSIHSLRQHLQKSLKHKDMQCLKFACSRCDKRYDTEAKLQHHVSVQHEGVRAYRCPQCAVSLASASSLRKHIHAVHRGHRPPPRHVCDACGKAFRGKSVLTNHVRTHTGERPFPCAACGRAFAQRAALRTHTNLVHLKLKRHKIKPEVAVEPPKLEVLPAMFPKEETPVFEWGRPPPCDGYFTVTAGP